MSCGSSPPLIPLSGASVVASVLAFNVRRSRADVWCSGSSYVVVFGTTLATCFSENEPQQVLAGLLLGEITCRVMFSAKLDMERLAHPELAEPDYTCARFCRAFWPEVAFHLLFAGIMVVLVFASPSTDIATPCMNGAIICVIMAAMRWCFAWAMPPSQGLLLSGRLAVWLNAAFVVGLLAPALRGHAVAQLSDFEVALTASFYAISIFLYRLKASHAVHIWACICMNLIGECARAALTTTHRSAMFDACVLGFALFAGEIVGTAVDGWLRKHHALARASKEIPSSGLPSATEQASSAHVAVSEFRPEHAATAETAAETAAALEDEDRAYRLSLFQTAAESAIMMCSVSAALNLIFGTIALRDADCTQRGTCVCVPCYLAGSVLLAFLAAVRLALCRMSDQSRARLLFGRIPVGTTFAMLILILAFSRLHLPLPPVQAFEFGLATMIMAAFPICYHLSGLPMVHRLAFGAFAFATHTTNAALSGSPRGALFDAFVTGSALGIAELVGFTIESTRRQERKALLASQRALQQAEERTRAAKDQVSEVAGRLQHDLVAYLFHELRNDANATVGVMDTLRESVANCVSADSGVGKGGGVGLSRGTPSVVEWTTELDGLLLDGYAHAHHAAQVITNLLDWTKLRAGKLHLPEDQPFQLEPLGSECLQLVRHLLQGKPVVRSARMALGSTTLLGAPVHLKQVLLNLLTNAAKYTSEGSILLSADVVAPAAGTPTNPSQVRVRFAVEDTGCGVLDESRDQIFDEFEQGKGPDATSPIKIGTGLGLPLCRSLVALMGGHLELSSPGAGRGAVFSFTIWLKRAHEPPPLAPASEAHAAPLRSGLRVLVADDQALNRKLLIRSLTKQLPAAHFTEVGSGHEARELLTAAQPLTNHVAQWSPPFDLAFLDENFGPDQPSGMQVTREARAHELKARVHVGGRCIIIGVTGDQGITDHEDAAHRAGQDAVWGKPFPKTDIMRASLHALLTARGGETH